MKKTLAIMSSTVILLVIATMVPAQVGEAAKKKTPDPRVRKLLDEADMTYKVDEDGDYRLVFGFEDDRTQLVFIFSNTEKLGDMEIREIWSVGYLAEDEEEGMTLKIAKDLLRENSRVKLGAWELGRFSGKEAGIFTAKIAAETRLKSLLITLRAVAVTADKKEEELLGTDEL